MKTLKSLVAVWSVVLLAGCAAPAQSQDPLTATTNTGPVAIAQQYIGLNTRSDRKELSHVVKVDPRSTPWCAAFVNAILERAGFDGTGSLMARSFLHHGTVVRNPARGDIVVLRRGRDPALGHVGFYMGEEDGYIRVLGGNQQGAVSVSLYSKSRLLGYRRIAPGSGVNFDLAHNNTHNNTPNSAMVCVPGPHSVCG